MARLVIVVLAVCLALVSWRSDDDRPQRSPRPDTADELGQAEVVKTGVVADDGLGPLIVWSAPPLLGSEIRIGSELVSSVPPGHYDEIRAKFDKLKGEELAKAVSDLRYARVLPERFAKAVAECWDHLSVWGQVSLLRDRWEQCRCPEIEARLVEITNRPFTRAEWHDDHLPSIALARLYEFQPQTVRAIVLDDLARPNPKLNRDALLVLPDAELPQLDQHWQEILRGDVDGDWWKIPQLVERYASRALLPAVAARADRRSACTIQWALLGYWIKHDRMLGLDAIARASHRRDNKTGCWRSTLYTVLPKYWGPDAEALGLAFLKEEVEVASNVARMLVRHGSKECLHPLLDWAANHNQSLKHEVSSDIIDGKRWTISREDRDRLWVLLGTGYARDMYREALGR